MKTLVLALGATFLLYAGMAEAQDAPQPAPAGNVTPASPPDAPAPSTPATLGAVKHPASVLSFLDPDVVLKSAEVWAQELEKCDTRRSPWRLTCAKLLEAYNVPEQIQDFKSIPKLTAYIRSQIGVRACPSPEAELVIAGAQGDGFVFITRTCRPYESLFFDIGKNLAFASTVCGQPIKNPIGAFVNGVDNEGPSAGDEDQRERWLRAEVPPRRGSSPSGGFSRWLDRNKKWVIPVAAGVGGGFLAAALLGDNHNTNTNTNRNCNGVPCK